MSQPAVSIIVTTYNIADYIDQCLHSLVKQTIKDIQIIIVDDGSTDGTLDVIKQYSEADNRITVIALEDNTPGGTGTPANIGIDKATGKYIGFADGDDWYELDMFELLFKKAEQTKSDFVFCNYKEYETQTEVYKDPADTHWWQHIKSMPNVLGSEADKKMLLRIIAVPWRKLYKHEFIKKYNIRYPEGDFFYEDNPLHWFVVIQSESFSAVNKVLCYHRTNREGQTMSSGGVGLIKMFIHHQTIFEWLKKQNLLTQYKVPLYHWLFDQTFWISHKIAPEFRSELFKVLVKEFNKYSFLEVKKAILERKEKPFGSALMVAIHNNKFKDYESLILHTKKADPFNPMMIAYRETPKSIYSFLSKKAVSSISDATGMTAKKNQMNRIEEKLNSLEKKLNNALTKVVITEASVTWLMDDIEEIKKAFNSPKQIK